MSTKSKNRIIRIILVITALLVNIPPAWAAKDFNIKNNSQSFLYVNGTSGNVGIGSVSPGQLLDVQGTARMTGFTLSNNGAASGNVMVTNGVGVGTWMAASTLPISGGAGTNYWLNDAGNIGINTTYNVGIGTISQINKLNILGNIGIGTFSYDPFMKDAAPNGGMIISGNVGIGTWVPQGTLDIEGGTAAAGVGNNINIVSQNGSGANVAGNINLSPGSTGGSSGTVNINNFADLIMGSSAQISWNLDTPPYIQGNVLNPVTNLIFSVSGGNDMYINTNGNVGIGSANPGKTLDVQGTARMIGFILSNNGAAAGNVMVTNAVGLGTWMSASTLPGASASNYWLDTAAAGNVGISTMNTVGIGTTSAGAGSGLLVMNGDVGIGTWIPAGSLDIKTGNPVIFENGNVGIGSDKTPDATLEVTQVTGTPPLMVSSTVTASGDYLIVNNGGNVGINTTNPQSKLTILGNIGIGTISYSKYLTTTAPSGGMIVEGNVGIGTPMPTAQLEVAADLGVAVGYNVLERVGRALSVTGAGIDMGYYSDGTADVAGFIRPNGGLTDLIFATNTGVAILDRLHITGGGNVGISSTVPGQVLDVQGTVRTTGFAMSGQTPISGYVLTASDSGGDTTWTTPGDVVGWTVVGNNVYETSSGNVGIGTSSLQTALAVTNGNVGIGTWTAAGGNLIVKGGGNVGIGSAWPGQMLDVQGTARMTGFTLTGNGAASGTIMVSNLVGVGTWMSVSTLPAAAIQNETTGDVTFYSGIATLTGGPGFQTNGTNVGIGTNGFSQASLQVVGNIGIGTVANGDNFITTSPPKGGMIIESNVGIGSIAPGQKLDVQGVVRANGANINGNIGIGTWPSNNLLTLYTGATAWSASPPTTIQLLESGYGNPTGDGTVSNGDKIIFWNRTDAGGGTGLKEAIVADQYGLALQSSGDQNTHVAIWTAPGPSGTTPVARLWVDDNGNVGIGTITTVGGMAVMDGNVGIGTWVPGSSLQVNNTFTFQSENNIGSQGGAFTVNWNLGNREKVTLTGSTAHAATFTAPTTGVSNLVLKVVQGSASNTITWPAAVKWPSASTPTLTTTNGQEDLVSCYWDGTDYLCTAALNYTP